MFPRFPACRAAGLAIALLVAAAGCRAGDNAPPAGPAAAEGLAAQAGQFPREVREVAPGVHVALGHGLANSVMVRGRDGVVIVDTLESAEAARPVRDAFRAIDPSPVAAIIYTHNHADHVFGAGVFAEGSRPEVIAHASFAEEQRRVMLLVRGATWRRSMRQFGSLLPGAERLHCGIGPTLKNDAASTIAPLLPTRTFDGGELDLTVAGVRMLLLHLPGETPDQLAVWLPDHRVLLSGDNYYQSFPNLYTIRGSGYRDVMQWVASIDRMRALEPEVLVPGHTLPVHGRAEVESRLVDYRDAIQFVHDQTVRGMNEGKGPDELAETVRLPASLASKPWLAEHYGRVDWSVRGVFDGYLGWFGGDAKDLSPLPRAEKARRMARLAGGSDKLRDAAREALAAGDAAWAAELAAVLRDLGEHTDVAGRVRADALRLLAAADPSANGRNYRLTQALEAEEKLVVAPPDPSTTPDELSRAIPVGDFLRAMTVRLDPAKAEGKSWVVGLRFPDVGEEWGMRVRNGVVELQPRLPEDADMTVTAESGVWKDVLLRKRNATAAFASGDVKVDRNRLELVRFLFLFR